MEIPPQFPQTSTKFDATTAPSASARPSIPLLSTAIERLSNRSSNTANNNNIMNANVSTPPIRYVPERRKISEGNADAMSNRVLDPDSVRA